MKYLKLYEDFDTIEYYVKYIIKSIKENFLINGEGNWKIVRCNNSFLLICTIPNEKSEGLRNHILNIKKFKNSLPCPENFYKEIEEEHPIMFDQLNKSDFKALDKLLIRMGSYEFQKEFLTKYPDNIDELKPFGYNNQIKKEFKHLFIGKEWGFFDLERSSK